jgi:hypothetical protein
MSGYKAKEKEVFKNTRTDYKRHLRFIVGPLSTLKTNLALRIGDPNERVPYGHSLWECFRRYNTKPCSQGLPL